MPHILLLGAHGQIAQLLTPLLLARSWSVTSLLRTASQAPTIEALAKNQPGKLSFHITSLSDIKTQADAQHILDATTPDWIIWSAGAGGKGGPETTLAIDRDAAIAFTRAAAATRSVKKFLTVSYLASRRGVPSWWTEQDARAAAKINHEVLPTYYQAKIAADEVLTVLSRARVQSEIQNGVPEDERFAGISLRPGTLTDAPAGGVRVGRIGVGGTTSRETTARVVVAALESGFRGWLDVVDGEEGVEAAVRALVERGVDTAEEEDWVAAGERVEKL